MALEGNMKAPAQPSHPEPGSISEGREIEGSSHQTHQTGERAGCGMQGKKIPRKSHLETSVRSPAWPNVALPQRDMNVCFITEFLTRACSFLREYCSSVLRNGPRMLSQTQKLCFPNFALGRTLPTLHSRDSPSLWLASWFYLEC